MPADKFGFKPTPAAEHIRAPGGSHDSLELRTLFTDLRREGAAHPPAAPKDDDREGHARTLTLKTSFQFCTDSLAPIDDSHFGEQVPFFGGKMVSRGFMVITMSEDLGDHYSNRCDVSAPEWRAAAHGSAEKVSSRQVGASRIRANEKPDALVSHRSFSDSGRSAQFQQM